MAWVNLSLELSQLSCRSKTVCNTVIEGHLRTYMASSKFFSAIALLPRALSSSAEAIMSKQDSGRQERVLTI